MIGTVFINVNKIAYARINGSSKVCIKDLALISVADHQHWYFNGQVHESNKKKRYLKTKSIETKNNSFSRVTQSKTQQSTDWITFEKLLKNLRNFLTALITAAFYIAAA